MDQIAATNPGPRILLKAAVLAALETLMSRLIDDPAEYQPLTNLITNILDTDSTRPDPYMVHFANFSTFLAEVEHSTTSFRKTPLQPTPVAASLLPPASSSSPIISTSAIKDASVPLTGVGFPSILERTPMVSEEGKGITAEEEVSMNLFRKYVREIGEERNTLDKIQDGQERAARAEESRGFFVHAPQGNVASETSTIGVKRRHGDGHLNGKQPSQYHGGAKNAVKTKKSSKRGPHLAGRRRLRQARPCAIHVDQLLGECSCTRDVRYIDVRLCLLLNGSHVAGIGTHCEGWEVHSLAKLASKADEMIEGMADRTKSGMWGRTRGLERLIDEGEITGVKLPRSGRGGSMVQVEWDAKEEYDLWFRERLSGAQKHADDFFEIEILFETEF